VPFLTLLLLQLLVAGRVSLQAGGSGAASTLPAAAGLELDLQHARPGLGARSQGAKLSTCWGRRASESESGTAISLYSREQIHHEPIGADCEARGESTRLD